mgnify:CR=1 FL=1
MQIYNWKDFINLSKIKFTYQEISIQNKQKNYLNNYYKKCKIHKFYNYNINYYELSGKSAFISIKCNEIYFNGKIKIQLKWLR